MRLTQLAGAGEAVDVEVEGRAVFDVGEGVREEVVVALGVEEVDGADEVVLGVVTASVAPEEQPARATARVHRAASGGRVRDAGACTARR